MAGPAAALGYRGIVQMLSSASRGSYHGPRVSVDMLSRALGSTEGLDTAQLVAHTRAAVGSSDVGMMRGGIVESLFTFLAQAAFGEILGRVVDTVSDWFTNRDDSEDIVRDAEAVDKALCDIETVNETGIEETLFALRSVIAQLCSFLNQVDPTQHPREFAECVAAGADLIDSAGGTIMDCCQDRDNAVSACLDEFLDRGTAVCEKPATGACTTVVCEQDAPAATATPVQGNATTVTDTPTVPQSVGEPVPEKPVGEPPAPTEKPAAETPVPEKPVPGKTVPVDEPDADSPAPPAQPVVTPDCEPTVPQSVEPVETVPEPECVAAPVPGGSSSSDCCGVLGVVGVGAALLGIGLLITALEDCVPEIPPAPEPPAPEPEPVSGPAAEPPAPPKPDLDAVPEPPPPPKQVVTAPAAAPAADPEVPVTPEPQPAPAAASTPGGARKAGAW